MNNIKYDDELFEKLKNKNNWAKQEYKEKSRIDSILKTNKWLCNTISKLD